MAIGDAEIAAEEFFSVRECCVERRLARGKTIFGDTQDEIGIGGEAGEDIALGGKGDTGKIGGEIEQIENDLEMKMGSPAAVFGYCADASEGLAAGDAITEV